MSIAKTLAELGIVDESTLREHKRWGQPTPDVELPNRVAAPEEAATRIQEELSSDARTEVRETDLDLRAYYLAHEESGTLHYRVLGGTEDESPGRVGLTFCRLLLGEIAIPWNDDVLGQLLLDPHTYIKDTHGQKMYFGQSRNIFEGEKQIFVVAQLVPPEAALP